MRGDINLWRRGKIRDVVQHARLFKRRTRMNPELSRAVYTAPVNLECGINHGMGQK